MEFFNFFNFFAFFFAFSIPRRVGTERNDNFLFSPFLSLLQPILARNGAIMVLFNFFAFFFEFSIMRQVGTERNDNFSSPPFSSSFNLWWLEMEP